MSSPATVWEYRTWIGNLAKRELTAKHKRSVLGWLWSLINPAATLIIYTLVFGTFMRIEPPMAGNGHTKSFALFLFVGLIQWNFFNALVIGSMSSLEGAGGMLSKVYFPPESPAIANLLSSLVQVAIETAIAMAVLAVLGNVSVTFVVMIPVVLLLAVFSLGVGLFVSVYNIMYRDVNYLVGIVMQALFYATPIIYPLTMIPDHVRGVPARWVIETLNPMTAFVGGARDALYLLQFPSLSEWLVMLAWSCGALVIGWWAFNRRASDLIEEL